MNRRVVAGLATATVVAVAFLGVLPRVADLDRVLPLIGALPAGAVAGLVVLALVNLVTYPVLSMASLPGLRLRPAFVVTQASTAVANTVPAGSAVGVGVTYAMYAGYGFDRSAIAVSITSTGVANVVVKLLMPAVATALLALDGDAPSWMWRAALIGLVVTVTATVLGWVVLRHPRLAAVRREARALRSPRGVAILVAAVVSHLALYALFAGCLAALGAGVPLAVSFAVFAVVRLGLAVPVTPGGVGVAEAGYAAALAAAGAAAEPAVAAVLLFRVASYLLPVPIGLVGWAAWRRRAGRTALVPATVPVQRSSRDDVRDPDRRAVPADRAR